MSPAANMHAAFVRAMEAEYELRVAKYRAAGLGPEDAHGWAFEDVKQFGREVLQDLHRRGLFPWPKDTEPKAEGGADVH